MLLVMINGLLLLLSVSFSHALPSYFPRCALDDPDLNNCIGRAANALRPYLRIGIKEIGFPTLDPLIISRINFFEESILMNYTGSVWNYQVRGLDNYDVTDFRYDHKTMIFNGNIGIESLSFHTDYLIKGSFLSIPIEGTGIARAVLGPVNATFEIIGKLVKRKGTEFYKPIKTSVRMVIGDGSFSFDGLFDGNEERGRITNEAINKYSKYVIVAMTPAGEILAEKCLMLLMKSLTRAVPYEELFILPKRAS